MKAGRSGVVMAKAGIKIKFGSILKYPQYAEETHVASLSNTVYKMFDDLPFKLIIFQSLEARSKLGPL